MNAYDERAMEAENDAADVRETVAVMREVDYLDLWRDPMLNDDAIDSIRDLETDDSSDLRDFIKGVLEGRSIDAAERYVSIIKTRAAHLAYAMARGE